MTDFQLAPPEKDICRIHTDRSNKHLSRISTSKLSKEELEDLYYDIFESNAELKRIVNQQKQTINALNAKVLRMTATRRTPVSSNPCCMDSRITIREQKEVISELKSANEKLMEKIRQLKVQLCTKKQFTKISPSQKTRARRPVSATINSSVRNKDSDTNIIVHYNNLNARNSTASLIIEEPDERLGERETNSSNVAENQAEDNCKKDSPENLCTENKCKTQMEELKEKINTLEEELNTMQQSYNTRIVTMEEEIRRLSKEEQAARAARVASQAVLVQRQGEAKKLAAALKSMEMHTNQLSAQLQSEKMKVSDLEIQLKANRLSNNMFDIIEDYFNNCISKHKDSIEKLRHMDTDHDEDNEIYHFHKDDEQRVVPSFLGSKRDSMVEESLVRANASLCEKVIQLQAELDRLKVFKAGQEISSPKKNYDAELFVDQRKEIVVDCVEDDYGTTGNCQNTTREQCDVQEDQDNDLEEYTSPKLENEKSITRSTENKDQINSERTIMDGNNTYEIKIPDNNTGKGDKDEELSCNENRENSLPNTYTLKRDDPVDMMKAPSPENTEYDVSSITEASSAKSPNGEYTRSSITTTSRSPTEPLSLGENKELSYSVTEYTLTSTERNTNEKSLGYLSDGELPSVAGNFILSCEWAELKEKYKHEDLASTFQETKAEKLKAALQQIKQHLMQCRKLQASAKIALHNSHDI